MWLVSFQNTQTYANGRPFVSCLYRTIMLEMYLHSFNTWSLQFDDVAVWLSSLKACLNIVLLSSLPTVYAIIESTVLCSKVCLKTGILYSIMGFFGLQSPFRVNLCVLIVYRDENTSNVLMRNVSPWQTDKWKPLSKKTSLHGGAPHSGGKLLIFELINQTNTPILIHTE